MIYKFPSFLLKLLIQSTSVRLHNATLPGADSELIIVIFRYFVNINFNLLGKRDLESTTTDATTTRMDMDVIMQELLLSRVIHQQGVQIHPLPIFYSHWLKFK